MTLVNGVQIARVVPHLFYYNTAAGRVRSVENRDDSEVGLRKARSDWRRIGAARRVPHIREPDRSDPYPILYAGPTRERQSIAREHVGTGERERRVAEERYGG